MLCCFRTLTRWKNAEEVLSEKFHLGKFKKQCSRENFLIKKDRIYGKKSITIDTSVFGFATHSLLYDKKNIMEFIFWLSYVLTGKSICESERERECKGNYRGQRQSIKDGTKNFKHHHCVSENEYYFKIKLCKSMDFFLRLLSFVI